LPWEWANNQKNDLHRLQPGNCHVVGQETPRSQRQFAIEEIGNGRPGFRAGQDDAEVTRIRRLIFHEFPLSHPVFFAWTRGSGFGVAMDFNLFGLERVPYRHHLAGYWPRALGHLQGIHERSWLGRSQATGVINYA